MPRTAKGRERVRPCSLRRGAELSPGGPQAGAGAIAQQGLGAVEDPWLEQGAIPDGSWGCGGLTLEQVRSVRRGECQRDIMD